MLPSLCLASSLLGDASSNLTWKEFQDPSEQAFALDVPEGWVVRGGLFRLGYSDARPMVDIQSADGRTEVRIGDVAIPSYFVPNQIHSKEGDVYDLGQQAQLIVATYRSGADYARLYALARFTSVCKTLAPQSVDSETPVTEYIPLQTAPAQSSAWAGGLSPRLRSAGAKGLCLCQDGSFSRVVTGHRSGKFSGADQPG
jgi:hypothetical protein